MSHQHQSVQDHSASSASSLYRAEDAGDVFSYPADTWISHHPPFPSLSSSPSSTSCHYSLPSDENTISRLIDLEPHHMPLSDYLNRCRDRSIDVTARQDSINWILKVHEYYHFSPVTALLSVNYFDRFLSIHTLPQANGWPFQLLSVACLSLAAKMEEPQVPLLIDLQIFEPRFVFEPKTVRRMELSVMSNLSWRLRSVTPFDYLHYFISKLPSSSSTCIPDSFSRVLSGSSDLILSTTRVIDFLDFAPSTIAAAAVFCAAGQSFGVPVVDGKLTDFFHERVNREMVRSCHHLMEEYLIDTCPAARLKELRVPEPQDTPPSPVGVLDAAACGSCDVHSDNLLSSSQAELPPAKRLRSSAPDVRQP